MKNLIHVNTCGVWYNDKLLEIYHNNEWCKVNHNDRYQFEMLCLEGASVGLSWKTIIHKRNVYKIAFHDFNIEQCATMTDGELEALLKNSDLIRNRNKIFSVRKNARAVKRIQAEFGSFDAYLWSFTNNHQIIGNWDMVEEMPTETEISRKMSTDMKKRGFSFVGATITYSFMQAIGIVNDHLKNCVYK